MTTLLKVQTGSMTWMVLPLLSQPVQGGGIQPKVVEIQNIKEVPEVFKKFVYEINGERYLIRIRKLTPIECWRLMGFSDIDYNKAQDVNSKTQLYKQAGNSIVKQVLMNVFKKLYEE